MNEIKVSGATPFECFNNYSARVLELGESKVAGALRSSLAGVVGALAVLDGSKATKIHAGVECGEDGAVTLVVVSVETVAPAVDLVLTEANLLDKPIN